MSKNFIDKVLKKDKKTLLSIEDTKRLIDFIEEGQAKVDDAKRFLLENTKSFTAWLKFQTNRTIYDIDSPEFKDTILYSFICQNDMLMKMCRSKGLNFDSVYDAICFNLKHSRMTQEEFNTLRECIVELNFGGINRQTV